MDRDTIIEVTHAKHTETHGVCSDCISRQAVFCILKNKMADRPMDSDRWVIRDIGKAIESLPPVEPEPKTGKWETDMVYAGIEFYRCDQCDFRQSEKSRYCPNCGADMRGAE